MDTKQKIRAKALELLNREGVRNVTLRDVAGALGKSYGNITYHYANKEILLEGLYNDMLQELSVISANLKPGKELLELILKAPEHTFDLSIKYLFFFKDFVEIRRHFPELSKRIDKENAKRKQQMLPVLKALQEAAVLRADMDDEDIDYIMELSGAMRTMFFVQLPETFKPTAALKKKYVDYVNRLLKPYLNI